MTPGLRWRYNIRLEAATGWHWLRQGDVEKADEFARRLLDTANEHEVYKYIAEAHRLEAQIAIVRGDDSAVRAFNAGLAELENIPHPRDLRTYGDTSGHLHRKLAHATAGAVSFQSCRRDY
jgi:DNA-binding GntR family transcriptional regulator